MIERNGDMFTTDARYLAHGVNCKGLMGSGIAVQFRKRFPEMHAGYVERCRDGRLTPGDFWVGAGMLNGRTVLPVNLASQDEPGANAHYHLLFSALQNFAAAASHPERLRMYGGIVAIPEIGCGIGGLEWHRVKYILECIEKMYPSIEFEVWHYAG